MGALDDLIKQPAKTNTSSQKKTSALDALLSQKTAPQPAPQLAPQPAPVTPIAPANNVIKPIINPVKPVNPIVTSQNIPTVNGKPSLAMKPKTTQETISTAPEKKWGAGWITGTSWIGNMAQAAYDTVKTSVEDAATRMTSLTESLMAGNKNTVETAKMNPLAPNYLKTQSTPLQRGTKIGEAGVGLANLGFLPVTTQMEAAKQIPVIKYPATAASFGFEKLGQAGSFALGTAVDNLPLSQETKDTIKPLSEELGAFIAQMVGVKAVHGVAKKGLELKSLPLKEKTKAKISTAAQLTAGLFMTPFSTAYGLGAGMITAKVHERREKGIEITPAEGQKIIEEVKAELPAEIKASETKQEITYRGASKAEWERVQQTGKFEKLSGSRLIDKMTGKEMRTADDEAINTSPDKRVADLYANGSSKEGVVIEFKPEAKKKMKFSAKFDATDLKADEYLGEGLTLNDVAKVTDKNGKVIYEANKEITPKGSNLDNLLAESKPTEAATRPQEAITGEIKPETGKVPPMAETAPKMTEAETKYKGLQNQFNRLDEMLKTASPSERPALQANLDYVIKQLVEVNQKETAIPKTSEAVTEISKAKTDLQKINSQLNELGRRANLTTSEQGIAKLEQERNRLESLQATAESTIKDIENKKMPSGLTAKEENQPAFGFKLVDNNGNEFIPIKELRDEKTARYSGQEYLVIDKNGKQIIKYGKNPNYAIDPNGLKVVRDGEQNGLTISDIVKNTEAKSFSSEANIVKPEKKVKEEDNLTAEAKKYKSAEEFANSFLQHATDVPEKIRGGSIEKGMLASNVSEDIASKNPSYFYKTKDGKAFVGKNTGELKSIFLVKKGDVARAKEIGGITRSEGQLGLKPVAEFPVGTDIKSQLTDIWNKAQEKPAGISKVEPETSNISADPLKEMVKNTIIPEMEKLPETGTYPAVTTNDGSMFFGKNNETHFEIVRNKKIPPQELKDGGWIVDGNYEPTVMSDTQKLADRAKAIVRVQKKRITTSDRAVEAIKNLTNENRLPNGQPLIRQVEMTDRKIYDRVNKQEAPSGVVIGEQKLYVNRERMQKDIDTLNSGGKFEVNGKEVDNINDYLKELVSFEEGHIKNATVGDAIDIFEGGQKAQETSKNLDLRQINEAKKAEMDKLKKQKNSLLKEKKEYLDAFINTEEGQKIYGEAALRADNNIDFDGRLVAGIKQNPFYKKEGVLHDQMGDGYLMKKSINNKKGKARNIYMVATPAQAKMYEQSGWRKKIEIDSLASEAGFETGNDYLEYNLTMSKNKAEFSSPEKVVDSELYASDPVYKMLSDKLDEVKNNFKKEYDQARIPAGNIETVPGAEKVSSRPYEEKTAQRENVKEPVKETPPEAPRITPDDEILKSRVYERLINEIPENMREDVSYNKLHQEKDIENAIDLIKKDKNEAYAIAMGAKEAPEGMTATTLNITLAEKVLDEGNYDLYGQLVKNRSLRLTRLGQEINAEKGSISDNSPARYIKELISTKLESLGRLTLVEKIQKGSFKEKAIEKIDKEVKKVKDSVKMFDLKEAQALIDKLTCV